jgi:hypothetical protein
MSVLVEDGPVHEHDHVVGFYDGDDDLVGAVAVFLADGLHHDDGAVVEIAVRDASPVRSEQHPIDPNRVGGRGIALIDRLAHRWGTRNETDGKTVWVELADP